MKKVCIIFLLSIIISLTAIGFSGFDGGRYALNVGNLQQTQGETDEFLRIHIRADSNETQAQAVKYYVRDEIVNFLTPVVATAKTKAEAMRAVRARLRDLEEVARRVLEARGFFYGASAELTVEKFPTRVYGEYTLPSGEYAALIVRLGSGAGDNWWCVVYPPLCFAAPTGENVVYKSKIKEIIEDWKKRR